VHHIGKKKTIIKVKFVASIKTFLTEHLEKIRGKTARLGIPRLDLEARVSRHKNFYKTLSSTIFEFQLSFNFYLPVHTNFDNPSAASGITDKNYFERRKMHKIPSV